MLTKKVDGKEVICSAEEEILILMKWKINDQYPEYSGHLSFDGISEPKHVIDDCKKKHTSIVAREIKTKLDQLNILIEQSEENETPDLKDLLSKRKFLKSHLNPDLSSISTIAELKSHLEKVKDL